MNIPLTQLAKTTQWSNAQKIGLQGYIQQAIDTKRLSQAKLAKITGVDKGYISLMLNKGPKDEHFEKINDRQFHRLANELLELINTQYADTTAFRNIQDLCEMAANEKGLYSIVGDCGYGKTFALRYFMRQHPNYVSYMEVQPSRKTQAKFEHDIARAVTGMDTFEGGALDTAINALIKRSAGPNLLIIDDIYYGSDGAFLLTKQLGDELRGYCGIILAGEYSMRKRLEDGVRNKKIGFQAIKSRFFGRVEKIPPPNFDDYRAMASYHGLPTDHVAVELANGNAVDYRYADSIFSGCARLDINSRKDIMQIYDLYPDN